MSIKKIYRKVGQSGVDARLDDVKLSELGKILSPNLQANPKLQRELQIIFKAYALCGPGSHNSETTKEMLDAIRKWTTATRKLQDKVWTESGAHARTKDPCRSQKELLENYFQPLATSWNIADGPMMKFFARVLGCSIATSDYLQSRLQSPDFVMVNERELWFVWVALLARTLEGHGIKVTAASGGKMVSASPFVRFIDSLQEGLPDGRCVRKSDFFKGQGVQSIAKGVQLALKRYGHTSQAGLALLLASWASDPDAVTNIFARMKNNKAWSRPVHEMMGHNEPR